MLLAMCYACASFKGYQMLRKRCHEPPAFHRDEPALPGGVESATPSTNLCVPQRHEDTKR